MLDARVITALCQRAERDGRKRNSVRRYILRAISLLLRHHLGRAERDRRFADVDFGQLLADPVAAVEGIYARLELPFTEPARKRISAWAAKHPRGSRGEHRYRLEDFGLERRVVRERFAFYFERFPIRAE